MAIIDDEFFGELAIQDDIEDDLEIIQFSGLFGADYTDPIEVEKDLEEAHSATVHRDTYSAIRRRKIGGFFHRKAWKCLKFNTPKDFAKVRLGLGLASYHRIARIAEIELSIAKNSIKVEFLDKNVRDSFLIMLDNYPETSHVLLVETLAERRILFQGKRVEAIAEELGIYRKKAGKSSYSHTDANSGESTGIEQFHFQFSDDERRSAWEGLNIYHNITGKTVTIGHLHNEAVNFYLTALKRAKKD